MSPQFPHKTNAAHPVEGDLKGPGGSLVGNLLIPARAFRWKSTSFLSPHARSRETVIMEYIRDASRMLER